MSFQRSLKADRVDDSQLKQGMPENERGAREILQVTEEGGDEEASELKVLGRAKKMVWVIFRDKVGDVACGSFYMLLVFYSLGKWKSVEELGWGDTKRLVR